MRISTGSFCFAFLLFVLSVATSVAQTLTILASFGGSNGTNPDSPSFRAPMAIFTGRLSSAVLTHASMAVARSSRSHLQAC